MLTRPFYKKIISLFKVSKVTEKEITLNKEVSEFPLSQPTAPARTRRRDNRATKGAFGKCRYVFDTTPVTDPLFNHSLRRKK